MAGSQRDLNYYYQQSSFAGGELSPDVYGRNDFNKYAVGLSDCTNMYPLPFGGVVSRGGTEFITKLTDDKDTAVQMIPFTFSNTQNIVLVFVSNSEEKKVYFLADNGIIVKDGEPYTIDHTYNTSSVGNIQYAQSADILFLAESNHEPMKISRYDTYDWRFETFTTKNGSPFGSMNDTDITLSYKPKVDTVTYNAYNLNTSYNPSADVSYSPDKYYDVNSYSAVFNSYKGTITITATGQVTRTGYYGITEGSSRVELQKRNNFGQWVTVANTGNLSKVIGMYATDTTPITKTITYTDTGDDDVGGYYRMYVYSRSMIVTKKVGGGNNPQQQQYDRGNKVSVNLSSPQTTQTGNPYPTLIASDSLFKSTDLLTWVRVDEAVKAHENSFRPSDGNLSYTGTAIPIKGQWSILMSGKLQGSFGIEVSYDNKQTWENYKLWNVKDVDTFQNSGEIEDLAFVRLKVNASGASGVVQLNVDSFINSSYAQITNVVDDKNVNVSFETHIQSKQYGIIDEFTGQYNFAFSSWTPNNGYPSAVAFYQNRLCWASTLAEPVGVWLSTIGDYYDYTVEIDQEDDQAISISLLSQSLNKINTLLSKSDLIGFTADGAWRISSMNSAQGLTSKTITANQQTFEGASNLRPLVINTRALYVLSQGATVRDISYDYSSDSYTGDDLTLLSRHLFRGHTISSWCYAQEPDSLVYVIRDDGVMLTLTYNKEQDVYAWAKHITDGEFVAVQSVPGPSRTQVYFIVQRMGKLYIETLSDRLVSDTTRMNFMDCSALYEGEETTIISGLDYLEGKTVQIIADGSEQPEQVVKDGSITLINPSSVVRVGLGYTKSICTMNLDYPRQDGTSQGRRKSTSIVKTLFDNSYGGRVQVFSNNAELSNPAKVKNKLPKKYGQPIELVSGINTSCVNARTDVNIYVGIEQDAPVPINILSIMVDIAWGG